MPALEAIDLYDPDHTLGSQLSPCDTAHCRTTCIHVHTFQCTCIHALVSYFM